MTAHRVMKVLASLIVTGGLLSTGARGADLTIAVEPIYTADKQIEVYKPFIEYLDRTTGHKFKLVTSRNFQFFWRDIRKQVPVDFMFTEAHFTDYVAKRQGYTPLVRTAENSSYSVLANETVAQRGINSLIGYSVATMPSPSMGFALLAEIFPDPIRQPNVLSSGKSWRDGVEMVFAEETDAAIVPTWLKNQYPNLVSMTTTREFPGAAVSVASTVDEATREQVKDALLKLHEDSSAFEVLNELGISQFVPTSAAEYDGYDKLLKSFFGYKEVGQE